MIKCRCWTFYLQYFSVPLNHELKLESNNTAMQRQQQPRKLLKCSSAGNDIFHHVFQTTQWLWNGVRILQTDTKIHVLCFVEINCVLLNLLCVWILWNASSHFCFRSLCVTLEQNLNLIRWQKTMPSIIIVFLSLSLSILLFRCSCGLGIGSSKATAACFIGYNENGGDGGGFLITAPLCSRPLRPSLYWPESGHQ